MNKTFAIATVLTIAALATISAIPMAEAKPLKTSEVIIDLIDLSCSANHGILTCTVKSFSGGTIGPVILTQNVSGKLPLCDVDYSNKKRISVTNRNSENCTEPFVEDQKLKITVIKVDGTVKNLEIEIAHKGDFLEFTTV